MTLTAIIRHHFSMLISVISLLFLSAFSLNTHAEKQAEEPLIIRIAPKQSDEDVSHDYLVSLLHLAIKETEEDFGPAKVEFMPIQLGQDLVMPLLEIEGILDVVASAPTRQREIQFRAARFPLLMGLIGYRMLLIRPQDVEKFAAINKPSELKSLKACQGSAWPDADILEEQGYTVIRVEKFETMFDYLQSNRCDYFPRGITEGYGELEAYNNANPDKVLHAFDDILIHYTVPMFFFTSHQNFELSYRIETGLHKANEKGLVEKLMRSHSVTKSAYPLSKWKNSIVFEVANPKLLKTIPLDKPNFWQELPTKARVQ